LKYWFYMSMYRQRNHVDRVLTNFPFSHGNRR
jgi:hypothetical protein